MPFRLEQWSRRRYVLLNVPAFLYDGATIGSFEFRVRPSTPRASATLVPVQIYVMPIVGLRCNDEIEHNNLCRPPDALNRRPTVRNRYTRLQRASQGHLVLGQSAIELGKFKHGQDLHSPSICRSSYPRPDTAPILAMALSSMNPVVQYFSSHSRIRAILDEFITKRRRRRHRRSPWREWSPMVVMSHMHVPRGHQSGPCAAVKTYTFEFRVAMLSICVTNHRRPRALIYDLHSWASLPAEGNEHQLDSLREFEGLSSCVLPMKQPKDAP
ncbi:hypothetical protein C8Q74DRAFT_1252238 [Fomes fomentarius]|nr:hypothetical protein C8Q74DRAFT_1252238 [Fomes fomentarius]